MDQQHPDKPLAKSDDALAEPVRPVGHIRLFDRVLKTWQLHESDAVRLLGLEPSDKGYVAEVLAGRKALRDRDANDRIALPYWDTDGALRAVWR